MKTKFIFMLLLCIVLFGCGPIQEFTAKVDDTYTVTYPDHTKHLSACNTSRVYVYKNGEFLKTLYVKHGVVRIGIEYHNLVKEKYTNYIVGQYKLNAELTKNNITRTKRGK